MLFTDRSLWTMVHGIVLGGSALMALTAALFAMGVMRVTDGSVVVRDTQSRSLAWLMVSIAVVLWLAVFVGTYIIFPPYRATPPDGVTDLSQYPRSLLLRTPIPHGCMRLRWRARNTCPGLLRCSRRQSRSSACVTDRRC